MGGRKKPASSMTTLLIRLVLTVVALLGGAAPRCAALNPRMLFLVKPDPIVLRDHGGALLTGNLTVNLPFYSAARDRGRLRPLPLGLGRRASPGSGTAIVLDELISLGTGRGPLSLGNVTALARAVGHHRGAITAVLTAADVPVASFCVSRCGVHDHDRGGAQGRARYTYLWAGNAAQQCPGQCAWPFHRPTYGPQTPPLVPPNGDAGVDGMVVSLAALLAGTVTNPCHDEKETSVPEMWTSELPKKKK
ncbi:unnamed protein product [Miscanthus lutarioriparius]|uniref:Uncharacterized protein n=1 Tax=Miscanthus lutarioriparius TaxID=422564 RepID=A0A811SET5_9POAL|nr:unnamed protein product [Miscanthus lutarioriparius]